MNDNSQGVSNIHRIEGSSVYRERDDDIDRWLREMCKYVSFTLEDEGVLHFKHLLKTIALALVRVRGNGKTSNGKGLATRGKGIRNILVVKLKKFSKWYQL